MAPAGRQSRKSALFLPDNGQLLFSFRPFTVDKEGRPAGRFALFFGRYVLLLRFTAKAHQRLIAFRILCGASAR